MGSGTEHSQCPPSEGGRREPAGEVTPSSSSSAGCTLSQQLGSAAGPFDALLDDAAAAGRSADPLLPPAFSLRVPHFQQAYNWDCGVACVLMVLQALGMRQYHMGTLLDMCPTRSIWTIDLAHLLSACGARCQLATTTLGANQAYSGEGFYAESILDDSARVERLFRDATAAGIGLACRSVPLVQLRALLLGGGCLVVALVDKHTLASRTCGTVCGGGGSRNGRGGGACSPARNSGGGDAMAAASAEAAAWMPVEAEATVGEEAGGGGEKRQYLGHYIVLCGYDSAADEFEMRDPASHRERLWVPAARLEAARKQFGTDEDLLLVAVPSPTAVVAPKAGGGEAAVSPAPAELQQQRGDYPVVYG